METTQAKELISDIFQNRFRREHYQLFLRNLLNDIELRDKHYLGNLIPPAFKEQVSQYWRIGKYVDPEGHEMDLLVVELTTLSKLDHARSMLRSFAVNRLKTFNKECSLIAFYSREDNGADWRFSYVKIEHQAFRDDKGKVKIKDEFTPARRCSYLVGEHENSYTAARQLLPLLERDFANPRMAEIEAAFSIEKVTDEFFEQYKLLYLKLSVHLEGQPLFLQVSGEEPSHSVARFAKKLLGQIVFLYFLQKKGWLGVAKDDRWGAGSRRFMRDRFGIVADEEKNYYRDFLQYLFYEALAKERKDQDDPGYYHRFDCKIPFLNGGLFEADYDLQIDAIDLPNSLFHNREKNKGGDEGTGILDVFDRYNFTIKEDEPLEKEVAVDPEMLGKVFENMLDVTERKSKGAFYTPREIVHYMCQESLIHYLDTVLNSDVPVYNEIGSNQASLFGNEALTGQLQLTEETCGVKISKEDIETLIHKGYLFIDHDKVAFQREERIVKGEQKTTGYTLKLPESVRKNAQLIDKKLAAIRACDPAIGSGAFPVGLLHEIVTARLALAEHLEHPQTAYALKRHTIRESLYGVDLDQSAIDIARLRLWLSLIVDEEDYSTIEALPNLDYKIVRGNSLIGWPRDGLKDDIASNLIEDMKFDFYEETEELKRKEKRKAIDFRLQEFLKQAEQYTGYTVDFDFELFFSEVWHKQGGFDIVIGNPPYVQIQHFSGQSIQKSWEKQYAFTFAKTGDIYCLFYEKGFRLLRKNGVLAFITSNKWMRANYGEKLRKFFVQQTNPLVLIDFSGFQVFTTATVDANILIAEKAKNRKQLIASSIDKEFTHYTNIERFVEEQHITLDDLSEKSWSISKKTEYRIRQRIEKVGTLLKYWNISINRGILTGYNDAFIIDGKKKDELIGLDPKNAEIIKPLLNGRNIKRYQINFNDAWLLFIPWHFPLHEESSITGASKKAEHAFIQRYPDVYDFLAHHKTELLNRNQSETGIRYEWYALQRCAASYYSEFAKQKIVWGNLALKAQFALADPGIFLNAPSNMITDGGLYLLAVLNSGIGDYYIRSLGVTRNGGYFEYKPMFVEKLPVPQIRQEEQDVYIHLVNYVLILTKHELKLQSVFFEQLIDALVYELYFPEEIKAAGKEILHHIVELKPIPDIMTDAEKLTIIQSEFDRLYDPNHPVRNNLETLDSVEEVRIIREALKR